MNAPRRPSAPGSRQLWWAVALAALGLALWMALLAGMVYSTWSAEERAAAAPLLGSRLALLALGWLAGVALITLGLQRLWRQHVFPPSRLAEQAQALLTQPNAPPLPELPAPGLNALAQSINALHARCAASRADLQAQIEQASARTADERNRLAALLAQLAQGVVVCNLDGSILLYNPRARLQLGTVLHAPGLTGGANAVGIGRSIYGVFDRDQVQHALARVQDNPTATAQFVTSTHGGRLLRVQLAPVCDRTEQTEHAVCTGFMLMLDDVTRGFDAAAERDRWLAEATGRSAAAAAVLQRLLLELAPPDAPHQAAWREAQAQCALLRSQAAALTRHAAEGLATRWPLEDMLAADLLTAAQHQLGRVQPVRVALDPAPPGLWLRVDSYLILQALSSLAVRLTDALPLRFLGLRLAAADDGSPNAHLDLFWDGLPISTQTVMTWELEPVGAGGQHAMLNLRDVLDRHRATLDFGRDRRRHEAFLRFVLPQATPLDQPAALAAPSASGGNRPEFYDFDLFQSSPLQGELDEQPLSALTYTVFDTETTGLNPSQGDQIIQIGAARIVNGRLLRQESWEQLVDPGRRISDANSAIHGITNDMVRGQPRIAEVLPAFHAFAQGTVLVAHNAAFDMKFLQLQEKATGLRFDQPVLDTLLLASVAQPQQDSHRLDALVQRFGIDMQGERHTALADALATAEVLLRLIPLLQAQGIHTLGQARAAAQKSYLARLQY